tara:strand:+ start:534 stop:1280 length:747 start_codon:yes stop_codon:yes gene_type:complete
VQINIITIFPDAIKSMFNVGVLAKAQSAGLITVRAHNPRDFSLDAHNSVDDSPYGGDPGMVMMAPPIFESVKSINLPKSNSIILLSPQGKTFTQATAERLSNLDAITLICGRYEGVDERVAMHLADEEISIGDYVLSGGESAAVVIAESVARLLPGVLGHGTEAIKDDSHTSGLIQHPQYTRPFEYNGWTVPEILRSGNHEAIAQWRRSESLKRTLIRRPDLLEEANLSESDISVLLNQGWKKKNEEF